jgi:hypothetical protein
MITKNKKFVALSVLLCSVFISCEDLTETNENPNGVQPEVVNPSLVLPTVLTEAGKAYVTLGYQDVAGVVQHTQKDAWSSSHNDYDWGGSQDWAPYYTILRNNELVYNRAVELNMEFHQGVSLVMKSFMFGLITDLWGDVPYSNALKGDLGGENIAASFDRQEDIYTGILADLETANTLLSKEAEEYAGIVKNTDAYFNGNPQAWRRFANALALRYYMRISDKMPDVAKAGIEKIVNNPTQYPIITSESQDATMSFPGTSIDTSWPANAVSDASGSNYRRLKMAATFVEALQAKADPRLGVWANKVQIPLVVDANLPANTDEVVDGVRYLSPDVVGDTPVDTDAEYVGIPTAYSAMPSEYNMNPTPGQSSNNPHVSFLNDIYKATSGPLLKARLVSAAEVRFILAEAALKGWNVGDAQTHYNAGVKASLNTWGVGDKYDSYIAGSEVVFNNTLEQIMEQKWIASWTAATESWFDYRRTGFPNLQAGPSAKREVLPVRFYYMKDELLLNEANAGEALNNLESTGYTRTDGKNSAWSKPWILQGTGKPWE